MKAPEILVFLLMFILIFGVLASVVSTAYVFATDGIVEDDTNAGPPPTPPVEDDTNAGPPPTPPVEDDTNAGPPPTPPVEDDTNAGPPPTPPVEDDTNAGPPPTPPVEDDTNAGPPPTPPVEDDTNAGPPPTPPVEDDTNAGPPPTPPGSGSPPTSGGGAGDDNTNDQSPLPPGHIRVCEEVDIGLPSYHTICTDGPDSDGDGRIDAPILDHEICGDLSDNTGDGRIDEGCPHDDIPNTPTIPPTGNTPGVEICDNGGDSDHDGATDEGCGGIGINSGIGFTFELNPVTGVCFICVEDTTNAGPPPEIGGVKVDLASGSPGVMTSIFNKDRFSSGKPMTGDILGPLDLPNADAQPSYTTNTEVNNSKYEIVSSLQGSTNAIQISDSRESHIDGFHEVGALASAQAEPYVYSLNAEQVFKTKNLQLDADVKTLVIAVSNGVQSIDATSRNLKQLIPLEITVVEGTRITWLNSDLDYSHSIVVKSQGTSKGVYASSPIRYSESADFTFSDTGTYLYSDPKYGDVRGIIHVIAKDTPIDNESTDTNTKIVGLFISGLGQKAAI